MKIFDFKQIGLDIMKERERILSILSKTPVMNHEHPNFYHGRLKHFPTVGKKFSTKRNLT